MLGEAKLTNTGHVPCLLGEHIGVQILDPQGKPLDLVYKSEGFAWLHAHTDPQVHALGYKQGKYLLRPHSTAYVLLWWFNYCGRAGYPLRARIRLPSKGGTLIARPDLNPIGRPRCDIARASSVLFVGPVTGYLTTGIR